MKGYEYFRKALYMGYSTELVQTAVPQSKNIQKHLSI